MEEILNYIFGGSDKTASSIFDKEIEKFLKSATIKVTHNGKPLVDIENGVDKLNHEDPVVNEGRLSNDVRFVDNVYFLNKHNYEGERPEWKIPFVTEEFPGVTEEELITVLLHRFKDNPRKCALLNNILEKY